MVSIVVNPDKVRGVNAGDARALQDYLLSPAAPGADPSVPIFPAGRGNETAALPAA